MRKILDLLLPTQPVGRARYVAAGFLLMALKYAVDASLFYLVVGRLWHPLSYLNPLYAERMAGVPQGFDLPEWFVLFLLVWGLVFALIGTSWSIRRAQDAGLSGQWGLAFLVPFANYLMMLTLSLLSRRSPEQRAPMPLSTFSVGVLTGIVLLAYGAGAYAVLVNGLTYYGFGLFVSLPILFGVGIGYLFNIKKRRRVAENMVIVCGVAVGAGLVLMLFALEGAVCLVMAMPVVWTALFAGAMFGRSLAAMGGGSARASLCLFLALPIAAKLEQITLEPAPREVVSSIEINAPPEVVWQHVVSFSELPEPGSWLFKTGIAFPVRARIEGEGVGAIRYCEFSTGAFVEPITAWEEPRRLSFDVIEQPIPMEEWSFYDDVRPPHLTTSFRSVRGEFRLTPLAGGRTRLEGSTWYVLDMGPVGYWRLWSDAIVHRIHDRVLRHIAVLSEAEG